MTAQVKTGFIHGTGATVNVELGFVPDIVTLVNLTDGDLITTGYLGSQMAFTGGGVAVVKAGDKVSQSASIYTTVRQVILDSGSYAGGDAAGWLIMDLASVNGTFTNAAAEVNDSGNDDMTITAAPAEFSTATAAAVAGATTTSAITSYVGAAGSNAKGFTVGSVIAENAKLLHFTAIRGDANVDQTTVW